MQLPAEDIPADVVPFLPLAERWGDPDDGSRGDLLDAASPGDQEAEAMPPVSASLTSRQCDEDEDHESGNQRDLSAGPGVASAFSAVQETDTAWCARGELNPHVLSDTRT